MPLDCLIGSTMMPILDSSTQSDRSSDSRGSSSATCAPPFLCQQPAQTLAARSSQSMPSSRSTTPLSELRGNANLAGAVRRPIPIPSHLLQKPHPRFPSTTRPQAPLLKTSLPESETDLADQLRHLARELGKLGQRSKSCNDFTEYERGLRAPLSFEATSPSPLSAAPSVSSSTCVSPRTSPCQPRKIRTSPCQPRKMSPKELQLPREVQAAVVPVSLGLPNPPWWQRRGLANLSSSDAAEVFARSKTSLAEEGSEDTAIDTT